MREIRSVFDRGHGKLVGSGVADAVLSALATFSAGIYAARVLPGVELGAYALLMSALLLTASIPTQAFFVPVEAAIVPAAAPIRLGAVTEAVGRGSVLSAAGAAVVVPLAATFTDLGMGAGLVGLTITAAAAAALWPVQNHIRRMLYLGDVPASAALVSFVNLVGVVVGLTAVELAGWSPTLAPFGALALGNAASIAVGLVVAGRRAAAPMSSLPGLRVLWRSGRWLLLGGSIPFVGGLLAAVLVTHFAGGVVLGRAEAARIVAQPSLVVATGLAAIVRPRSLAAGAARDLAKARSVSRLYILAAAGFSLVYLMAVAIPWSWSPVSELLPAAYVVSGLVAATLVANGVTAMSAPYRFELIGGRRETSIPGVEVLGSALRTGFAASAAVTKEFALPLGVAALGLVRIVGFRRAARSMYDEPTASGGQPAD